MYIAEVQHHHLAPQAKVALRAVIPTADNPQEAAPQCTMVRRAATTIAIILDVLARLHPAQAAAVRLPPHHLLRVVAAHLRVLITHILDALAAQAIRVVVVAIADILHRPQAQVHHALAVAIVDVREALHPNLEAAVLIRRAAVRRRLIVDALVAHHLIIALEVAAPAVEAVLQAVRAVEVRRAAAPAVEVRRVATDNKTYAFSNVIVS